MPYGTMVIGCSLASYLDNTQVLSQITLAPISQINYCEQQGRSRFKTQDPRQSYRGMGSYALAKSWKHARLPRPLYTWRSSSPALMSFVAVITKVPLS